MPERIPDPPADWPKTSSGTGNIHTYDIELVTPLFGGGVATRTNDPSFPIRPTSIRGHLQFWWRATVGAQYDKLEDLRKAHSAIWGDTTQASRVQVRVERLQAENPVQCAHYEYRPPQPGKNNARHNLIWNEPFSIPKVKNWGTEYIPKPVTYALFPFQGEKAMNPQPGCRPKVEPAHYIPKAKFRLSLICDKSIEFARDVEPALWAWVNFGGLGSRTRRGCGAIFCKEFAPQTIESIDQWYRKHVPATSFSLREWPTMPTHFLCSPIVDSHIDQWNRVIAFLRDFRQNAGNGPGYARPLGPDRSWYPEPDTIRRITGNNSQGHEPSQHHSGGRPLPDGFPRAEFGLPIVFKFINDNNGDPKRTTLQPYIKGEAMKRMASPIILKPLALNGQSSAAIILPLLTPIVSQVALVSDDGSDLTPQHNFPVQGEALAGYPDSPMQNLTTNGSALEAFLNLALQPSGNIQAHPNTGYKRLPK